MNRKESSSSRKVSVASSTSSREPFPRSLVDDLPDSLTNGANGIKHYQRNGSTSSGTIDNNYNNNNNNNNNNGILDQNNNNNTKRKLSLFGRKLLTSSSKESNSSFNSSSSSFSRNTNNRPSIEDPGPPNSRNYSTVSGNNGAFISSFDRESPLSKSPMSSPPRSDGLDLEPSTSRNVMMGEGWDGWGTKMSISSGMRDMPTSPGTAAIAPWEYPEEVRFPYSHEFLQRYSTKIKR